MRAKLHAPLLLLLIGGALYGCSTSGPTSSGTGNSSIYRAEIITEMSRQQNVVDDAVFDDRDAEIAVGMGASSAVSPGFGTLAAIQPLTFARQITGRERTFEIAYSDSDSTGQPTSAVVTIRTHLTGTFNIRGRFLPDTTSDTTVTPGMFAGVGFGLLNQGPGNGHRDTTIKRIVKPLDEERVRLVLLRRARLPHDVPRDADCDHDSVVVRWRLAGVSGVEVTSKDNTTEILSLRVQSGSLDTTITDPLTFIRLRSLIKLRPTAGVTLTVTTNHTDDVVLLHYNSRRVRLTPNGDGTYSGTFGCRVFGKGLWHFAVDAISHATLYDDLAAYDSQRWAFPHVLAPNRMDGPSLGKGNGRGHDDHGNGNGNGHDKGKGKGHDGDDDGDD